MDNKKLGKLGEQMAEDFLIQKGYQIVEKNYLKRSGEIDLIAYEPAKRELIFVEVKTRRTKTFGHPEEAVTKNKLMKIEKAALEWLEEEGKLCNPWRIDVVSVELGKENKILHLENVTL